MIRAAILPYARVPGGACCVVVVHDGPVVLEREDIPVGHLATVDGRITRIVGPPEVAAVVARVVAQIRECSVDEANIEGPGGNGVEAQRGRLIMYAVTESLPGVELHIYPPTRGDVAARLHALMEDEGLDTGGATSRPIESPRGHPSSPSGGATAKPPAAEPTPAPPLAQAPKAGRRVLAIDPGSKHVAAVVVERLRVEGVGGATQALPGEPVNEEVGVRGGCRVDSNRGEPQHERSEVVHATHPTTFARYVASLSLTIGRDVPLRRPKLVTPKNGREPYYKMTRHEVTDEDLDELLRTLARFAAEHDVDEAAVEVATFAHKGAGAFLLRSNEIGGEVRGWLRAAGLPVRRVSSRVWRARVRKMYDGGERSNSHGQLQAVRKRQARDEGVQEEHSKGVPGTDGVSDRAQDARGNVDADGGSLDSRAVCAPDGGVDAPLSTGVAWRPAVRALVADLPPNPDAHIIDASGAALWSLAPERVSEVAPPAKPRAPRVQGGGKASAWTPVKAAAQQRKREAAKRARGCIGCVGQHQATCPIEVARLVKVAPSMRGNQNAARGAKV